jgi:hypothetical protein
VPLAKQIQSECLDVGYCVVRRSAGASRAPYVLPVAQYQLVWRNPTNGPRVYAAQQAIGKILDDCVIVVYDPPEDMGMPRSKISRCWERLAEMEHVYHAVAYSVIHRAHVVSQAQNSKIAGEMGPLEAESYAEGMVFRNSTNYAAQHQTMVSNSLRRGNRDVSPVTQTPISAMAHSTTMPAPTERVLPLNPGVTLLDTPHPEAPPDIEAIQTNLEQTVFRMYGVPVEILAGAVHRSAVSDGDNAMKKYNATLLHWQKFLSEWLTTIYNTLELEPFVNQAKGEWAAAVLELDRKRNARSASSASDSSMGDDSSSSEEDDDDDGDEEQPEWEPRRDLDAINGGPIKARRKRSVGGVKRVKTPGENRPRTRARPDALDFKRRMKQDNRAVVVVHRRYDIEPEQIVTLREGLIISYETASHLACARFGLEPSMCMTDEERAKQTQMALDAEVEADRQKQENSARAKQKYAVPKASKK